MITRRMVIGSGLAVAGLYGSGGDTFAAVASSRHKDPAVEALLIDQTIAMPRSIAGFAATRAGNLQVVAIDLDARAHPALMHILAGSKAIAGISSGATLFCLERLAWDHGFRLTQRDSRPADDTRWQDIAAILHDIAGTPPVSNTVQNYAPSRADGLLHSWRMQKRAPGLQHPGSGASL